MKCQNGRLAWYGKFPLNSFESMSVLTLIDEISERLCLASCVIAIFFLQMACHHTNIDIRLMNILFQILGKIQERKK